MQIRVDEVRIRAGRRELDTAHVQDLADSIKELGLLNPITVDKDNFLIAGLHRLEAAKLLGWQEIDCTISSLEGLQAELAEIDENFVRNNLPPVEYGEMLLRRKEIYEALHPESKHGGDRKSEKIKTTKCRFDFSKPFVEDTAEKLGVTRRTVERQIQAAKNLTSEAKEIIRGADTKISKKTAMKLSRLEPEQQQEAASLLAAKEIRSVDEYTAAKTAEETPPVEPEAVPIPPEPALPTPEPSILPYPSAERRCESIKEVVADLKNTEKDFTCTPEQFLSEYRVFTQKFVKEIAWYTGQLYEAALRSLSKEQLANLRRQTDSVCAAAEELYQKAERKE